MSVKLIVETMFAHFYFLFLAPGPTLDCYSFLSLMVWK